MAKLGDDDYKDHIEKEGAVCTVCDHVFLKGLRGFTTEKCPRCGGKLQIKILTRADTYLEIGD